MLSIILYQHLICTFKTIIGFRYNQISYIFV
nr:ALPV-276 [Albatrosspox virus]